MNQKKRSRSGSSGSISSINVQLLFQQLVYSPAAVVSGCSCCTTVILSIENRKRKKATAKKIFTHYAASLIFWRRNYRYSMMVSSGLKGAKALKFIWSCFDEHCCAISVIMGNIRYTAVKSFRNLILQLYLHTSVSKFLSRCVLSEYFDVFNQFLGFLGILWYLCMTLDILMDSFASIWSIRSLNRVKYYISLPKVLSACLWKSTVPMRPVIFASDCTVNLKSNAYPNRINTNVHMCYVCIRSERFHSLLFLFFQ